MQRVVELVFHIEHADKEPVDEVVDLILWFAVLWALHNWKVNSPDFFESIASQVHLFIWRHANQIVIIIKPGE